VAQLGAHRGRVGAVLGQVHQVNELHPGHAASLPPP
jgi:hypothetical protein